LAVGGRPLPLYASQSARIIRMESSPQTRRFSLSVMSLRAVALFLIATGCIALIFFDGQSLVVVDKELLPPDQSAAVPDAHGDFELIAIRTIQVQVDPLRVFMLLQVAMGIVLLWYTRSSRVTAADRPG
jgi:hypothetical protein